MNGSIAPDPAAAWAFRSGQLAACSSSTMEPIARSTANTAAARSQRPGDPATACRVPPSGGWGRGQRFSIRTVHLKQHHLSPPLFKHQVLSIRCWPGDAAAACNSHAFNLQQSQQNLNWFSIQIRPLVLSHSHHREVRKEEFLKSVLLFDDTGFCERQLNWSEWVRISEWLNYYKVALLFKKNFFLNEDLFSAPALVFHS